MVIKGPFACIRPDVFAQMAELHFLDEQRDPEVTFAALLMTGDDYPQQINTHQP